MKIKEWLKDQSDSSLITNFRALEDIIYNLECYGTKDMVLLHAIGGELQARGYKTESVKHLTKWHK